MTGTLTLRVLIVDDIPESRDNLERLLTFEPDFRVIGKATRGEEGIELALRLQPHVVLLDQTLPDRDGLEVAEAITTRAPGIGVILLGLDQDPEMLRRAMLAGAREYLTKPFSYEELVGAVRRVGRLANPLVSAPNGVVLQTGDDGVGAVSQGMPLGDVIAVLGSKGGIGRTFIATNLAILLNHRRDREVVLVDADLMRGDVAVMLNLSPQRSWADIARLPEDIVDSEVLRESLTRHASGVRVLLAPGSPEEAELIQPARIQHTLDGLRRSSDVIVVDTPGGFDDVTLACADMATTLLWVLSLEMTAIKDTKLFLELCGRLGYKEKRILLVLNRFNPSSGLTPDEVEESLRVSMPIRIPDDPIAVVRSVNEGTPLAWSDRQHRIVLELQKLVRKLEQEGSEAPAAAPRRRFALPRLRGGTPK
ncbi:MAG: response regulator [Thermomicrobium sp.]|nr:response regulator [Thermomicrobium sp.]